MPTISPYVPENSEFRLDFLVDGKSVDLSPLLQKADLQFKLNEIPGATFQFKADQSASKVQKQLLLVGFPKSEETPLNIEVHITTSGTVRTLFIGYIKSVSTTLENDTVLLRLDCLETGAVLLTNSSTTSHNTFPFDIHLQNFLTEAKLEYTSSERYSFLGETVTKSPLETPWTFLLNYLNDVGLLSAVRNGQFFLLDLLHPEPAKFSAEGGTNVFFFTAKRNNDRTKSLVTLKIWDPDNQEIKKITSEQQVQKNEELLQMTQPYSDSTFQRMADARIAQSNLSSVQGKITTYGNLEAQAGDYITFTGLTDDVNAQPFLITAESHTLEDGSWKTTYFFGREEELELENKVSPEFPPVCERSDLIDAFRNLQIGIVSALENDPLSQYRIKVRLPFLEEESEGLWARLSTLSAGKKRGSFFLPDINDEVIVGFLGNNLDSPVILGSLFSSSRPMPLEPTDENKIKGFITSDGTGILLSDQSIELHTKNGNKLILDDESGFLFQDSNKNKIRMNEQGITLETDQDFEVAAKGDINFEASLLKLRAAAVMELKGSIIKIN